VNVTANNVRANGWFLDHGRIVPCQKFSYSGVTTMITITSFNYNIITIRYINTLYIDS